ncbi:MAG: diguanylate cyclase, partial [Pseudomonadota bacterium]
LCEDRDALMRLINDHRLLVEAIETNPMPYCVYDAQDRLLVANSAYKAIHPALSELMADAKGGQLFYSDIVRHQLKDQFSGAKLEAEVQKRVEAQRNASNRPVEREYQGIGVFNVIKYQLSSGGTAGLAFDITKLKEREQQLEAASKQSALALEMEQERKRHGRYLAELGERLHSAKSLDELYRVVRRFMARLFPGSAGELYIYSNSRDGLDGVCEWNRGEALHAHIQPDDCWALRRGRVLRYGAGLADLTCSHVDRNGERDTDDLHYTCIPIIAHGDTVGLLHIRFPEGSSQSTEDDDRINFAIQCAEQISLAVANVRLRDELEEQSTRDPLTGLFNRRHFMNRFRTGMAAFHKHRHPLSLVSIDADHFKKINDVYGHDAGDVVLRNLSDTFTSVIEDGDMLARVGGEEFCLILHEQDFAAAHAKAERVRQAVEAMDINYDGVLLPRVTISCGVATADKDATIKSLLRSSDEALYKAKDTGRNRVCPVLGS